ncbi:MAG: DUF4192 domain-containing protein [Ornithinibacter sp.]
MTADITLRGPGDVLAVLPYQLGYHPRDSVVVVSLREKQIALVLRCDLPPDEHVAMVSASLVGPVVRERADSVLVLGFEEVEHASIPLALAVVDDLERQGVEVLDVQVVRGGRRYSPICARPCCPPEGEPVPGPQDVPAVAEFVLQGRSPLPDRRQVDDLVEAQPALVLGVAEALARRASRPGRVTDRRRRSASAWGVLLSVPGQPGERLVPRVLADLVAGLADVPWRDGVIAWLAPGVLPVSTLDTHVVARLCATMPRWAQMGAGFDAEPLRGSLRQLPHGGPVGRSGGLGRAAERDELRARLLSLCRAVPDSAPVEAAATCTLAAAVCWADGDGAVARAAIDRAVRLRPDYRLACLLERLIDQGVRVGSSREGGRAPSLGWTG